jgi:tyrosyl-tRNA synthetase
MPRNWWTWDDNPHTVAEAINTIQAFGFGNILVHGTFIDCKELKNKIDKEFFFIMSGFMKTLCIPKAELEPGLKLTQLLTDVGLTASNGEAAQKIKEGSVKMNTVQVKDPRRTVNAADLFEHWILLQKGKGDAAILMFWDDEE